MTSTDSRLRLRARADQRLRAGHVWVFSNEVDTGATPLKGLEPGQAVEIEDATGRWLGRGYANPNSLICARIVTRRRDTGIDKAFFLGRIRSALAMRERFYARPFYRLVYGESDGLPGAVVDRFGDYLVVQLTTAGMERLRDVLIEALVEVLSPQGILLRNDASVRELEGLPRYREIGFGVIPEDVSVEEGGCLFNVSLESGQKTGWFFDQASNRDRFTTLVRGRRVLDVCSYVGAWSVRAAVAGAREVVAVDASKDALLRVARNAELNQVANRVSTHCSDAFEVLQSMRDAGEQFDLVVLDPPAFVKRRKDLKKGSQAYRRLNEMALGVVVPDGDLVTASCSYHMGEADLMQAVRQAARRSDRHLQMLYRGQQAPDHPVSLAIPETAYLKTLFLRVLPGQ